MRNSWGSWRSLRKSLEMLVDPARHDHGYEHTGSSRVVEAALSIIYACLDGIVGVRVVAIAEVVGAFE